MKYLLFSITLFLCVNIKAQELPKKSKIFVRVFNEYGKKIAKGKILKITDSTLVLKKGSESIIIPSSEVTYLKTKRSNNHNVLLGAAGGAAYALYGATLEADYTAIAVVLFTPIFATIGAGTGYLTTVFKKSTQYTFAGDITKWKGFKEDMYAPKY